MPDSNQIIPGLCPWSGLPLWTYWVKGHTKGIAQNVKGFSTAGHSHHLTSGGKAEAATTEELLGKAGNMQDYHPNLGELRSAHRPSMVRIWIMGVITLGLLLAVLLGALLTLDSFTSLFTQTREGTFASAPGPLVCLGVSTVCFALFGSFLVSDFRKWSATKTVQLKIYDEGFTYEGKGRIEAYRWDEIKDINFRVIEIRSKHSAPTRARVIRSIATSDGTVINLAETLNLIKLTKLITRAAGR